MIYQVDIPALGVVEARSSVRLPFEPTGRLRDLRRDLAAACRCLAAGPDQILHATYISADRSRCDVENVLTYNLGTGAIRAASTYGLLLERRFDREDGFGHRYRYELAPADRTCTAWRPGRPLCTVQLVAPPNLFTNPRAGAWWLYARRGTATVHQPNLTTPERFLLRIAVTPPLSWRGSLAGLLKPLADGLISAMHNHVGPTETVVPRASTIDPTLTTAEFAHLLRDARPCALGAVRLVIPWGATLQWHPADDHIVGLQLRIDTTASPGAVVAEAHDAAATGAPDA